MRRFAIFLDSLDRQLPREIGYGGGFREKSKSFWNLGQALEFWA